MILFVGSRVIFRFLFMRDGRVSVLSLLLSRLEDSIGLHSPTGSSFWYICEGKVFGAFFCNFYCMLCVSLSNGQLLHSPSMLLSPFSQGMLISLWDIDLTGSCLILGMSFNAILFWWNRIIRLWVDKVVCCPVCCVFKGFVHCISKVSSLLKKCVCGMLEMCYSV